MKKPKFRPLPESSKRKNFDPDENLCKCGAPGLFPHSCPYSADIHNDSEKKCNCCSSCRSACAEDI